MYHERQRVKRAELESQGGMELPADSTSVMSKSDLVSVHCSLVELS